MNKVGSTFMDRFVNFVCDDEDVSTERIRADLQADGVDVDAFMGRVRTFVADRTSAAIRANAAMEIAKAQERNNDVSQQVKGEVRL